MGDDKLLAPPLVGLGCDYNMKGFPDEYKNPRGLPRTEFFSEDLDSFIQAKGGVQPVLRQVQEMYQKYKFFEAKLMQSRSSLKGKIPEITKTIETLTMLERKNKADEDMHSFYGLSDVVFSEAVIRDRPKKVGLWLGANVMVEYDITDAKELLTRNLATAQKSLEDVLEDLAWLRDQTAICEVNANRVHNWEVMERRKKKEALEKAAR
eukprot:TRINITY_DN51734_c0_g1_i1.p1 TRINITY_DN51734_c0_g1~~TRINITY_DN51734_c0_g1_i1.p1  ORF type:complete len:232 (+),score=105.84 TRINITY_DN51734_c0_g1_i1:73-696(+)